MSKVTLDMATFKALASDTRLDILRALDGKKMSLKDICTATNLNKATLHEHLLKLNEAGLVNKNEREGHKWVIYKLTWKGECLLHPENTKIVVLFSITFMTLFVGIINLVNYVKGVVIGKIVTIAGSTNIYGAKGESLKLFHAPDILSSGTNYTVSSDDGQSAEFVRTVLEKTDVKNIVGNAPAPSEVSIKTTSSTSQLLILYDKSFQWIAVFCLIVFVILLSVGIWWFWKNKKSKL